MFLISNQIFQITTQILYSLLCIYYASLWAASCSSPLSQNLIHCLFLFDTRTQYLLSYLHTAVPLHWKLLARYSASSTSVLYLFHFHLPSHFPPSPLPPPITFLSHSPPLFFSFDSKSNYNHSITWTLANSPYYFPSTVVIMASGSLTVEPGVVVQFGANVSLYHK
jgi:hypothetical protein